MNTYIYIYIYMCVCVCVCHNTIQIQIDVASRWREERRTRSTEKGCQTVHSVPQHRQRDEVDVQAIAESSGIGCQTDNDYIMRQQERTTFAEKDVDAFLVRMLPRVEGILESNINIQRKRRETGLKLFNDASDANAEHLYTFQPFRNDSEMEQHKLVCTSVSWSCTGNLLAASFGRHDIRGWCTTPGALCVWNVGDEGVDPEQREHGARVEHTDSCLMCCGFHPAHPALIAGGTFDGEICVWDTRNDNAKHGADLRRGRSQINAASHREPVVAVMWRRDAIEQTKYGNDERAYLLISLGADGRLLVWIWHGQLRAPMYGFELRHAMDEELSHRKVLLGGACVSFGLELGKDVTTCIVGTDGGAVLKCNTYCSERMAEEYRESVAEGADVLQSPIKYAYERHAGPVFSVDCCRSHRRVFASAGMDGTVRLYDSLQREPLMTLQPSESCAHAVRWSPHRPTVLAVATGDGDTHLYDFCANTLHPVKTLRVEEGKSTPVGCLEFNRVRKEFLATGSGASVKVWSLGRYFTDKEDGNEVQWLEALSSGHALIV